MKKRILRRGAAFFCALLLAAASFCEGVYAADEVTAVSSSGDYQIGADTADSELVEGSADEDPPGTVEAFPESGGAGEAGGEVSAPTEAAGETGTAEGDGEVLSDLESVEEPVEKPDEEANESYTADPTTGSAGSPPLSGEAPSAEADGEISAEGTEGFETTEDAPKGTEDKEESGDETEADGEADAEDETEAEEVAETEDEIGVIEDEETEEPDGDEETGVSDEPVSEEEDLFDEVFAVTAASGLIIEGEVCEEESWEGGCVPHLTVNGSPGFCILPWSNIPDCDVSFSKYEIPDEKDYINLMAKIMYFGYGGEGDILDDWNDGAYSGNEVAKEAITYYALCYVWIAQGGQGKDSESFRWYGSDDGGDLSEEGQKIVLSFVETVRNMTPDGTLTVTLESDTGEALSGATFGVYASEENAGNDSNPVAMLTTDVSGAASVSISSGTYYVRQLSAPDGYEVNAKIETGEVAGGEVSGTLYIAELCDQDRICQEAACAALSSSDESPLVLSITNPKTANEYLTHESAPASILSALDPSYIEYGDDTLGYGEIGNIELKRTYIREGYPSTIEGFFADDDNMSGFLTSVSSEIAIYDVNTDSDYVVGVLNAENEGFLEVDFARRNDNGQVLCGEYYDYATGLVYILKEDLIYIDEAEKIVYLNYAQAQALIQCSAASATATLMDYVGDGSIADLGDEGLSLITLREDASPSMYFDSISGSVEPGDYVDFVVDVRNGTDGQTMMDLFTLNYSGGYYYYHCLMDGDIRGADVYWNSFEYKPYSGNAGGTTPPYAEYYFEASTISKVTSNNSALSAWVNSLHDSGLSVELDCVHISTDNLYNTNANGMANVDVRMYVVETGTYGDNGHYAVISFCNVVNKAYPGWAGDGYQTVAATYVVWYEPNGELKLKKSSSDTDLTDGNSLYSLAGAKYGVYTDSSCKTLAKDSAGDNAYLTTDANGNSNTLTLEAGTYYVKEITAPTGYQLDSGVYTAVVAANETETVNASDVPMGDPISVLLKKLDAETGGTAQGAGTLVGAQYTVKYYAGADASGTPERTWVFETDADGCVLLSPDYKVEGDDLYVLNGRYVIPAGTISIQETKAPEGYLIDDMLYTVHFVYDADAGRVLPDVGYIVETNEAFSLEIKSEEDVIRGGGRGVKVDAGTNGSEQGDATLEGAEITIYNNSGSSVIVNGKTYSAGAAVLTVTTDASGAWTTSSDALPYGTYYVQETKASTGYLLNSDWRVDFEIREDGVIVDTSSETLDEDVIRGGVRIQKRDIETGYDIPEGAATFEGAEFTLYNESGHDVLVDTDEDGVLETYAPGAVITVLVTDENGFAQTSANLLPYGSYKVIETKAPEGYLKEGVLEQEFEIREDGVIVDMTAVDDSIIDEVKRGDVEFIKVGDSGDSSNMERLANVPFRITSLTTGESHIIMTDINGQASTASSWNAHSYNTNAGETSEDGIWFCGYPDGTEGAPVDDTLGALPYDTYLLEELPCEANEGYTLVRVQFTVYKDSVTVDLGTLYDKVEEEGPQITTELTNGKQKTNSGYEAHFAAASDDAYIIEEVTLINVNIGEEYTLKVMLMDGETGEVYTNAAGETYVIEKTVVPIASIETVKIEFDGIDCSDLAGKSLVAYAYLYDKDGNLVASEELIDKEDETVYFPQITTEAVISETGEHVSYAEGTVVITDTVSYGNVEYRGSFLLVGALYDAETGEKLPDEDGNPVTSRVTFEAKTLGNAMRHTAFGTTELTFSIDASQLAGKTIVTCEYLYDYQSMTLMAIENDLSNEEQSVRFVPVPVKEYTDEDMYEGLIVDVGDEIGYTLTWSNKTQSSQYIKLKDTLSAGLTYKDGSANVEPESVTVNDDGTTTVIWNLGLKDSAAYGTISYVATVNETAKTEAEDYSVNNRYELSVSNDPDTDAYEFVEDLENPLEPPEETEELPEITPEPQDITPEPKSNEPGTHTSPLTGDGSNTASWFACFAAAVCALIAAVIIRSIEDYSAEHVGERLRNAAFCASLYRFICKGGIMRRERKWKKRQKRRSRPEKAINR